MSSPAYSNVRSEDRLPIDAIVVSPNPRLRQELRERLGLPRWRVSDAGSGAEALERLHETGIEHGVLLLDPMLPDLDPLEFDGMVRSEFPNLQILTLNSHTGQLLVGRQSPTPLSTKLMELLNNRIAMQAPHILPSGTGSDSEAAAAGIRLRGMIGDSAGMQRVYASTRMVAARDTTVLITGESGVGKDLVAQAIHLVSKRSKQPFVVVNCAAIPEPLLESELFGYVKGAFTGAVQSRMGRIHAAHGGTLFLDEIGDMPLSLQSKMLRFLEQGEVQRLGGNDNLKVDVRVVAATNADLKKLVDQKLFREDLYYRLRVFPIQIPPLRERMEDLESLAASFADRFCPGTALSQEALAVLLQHSWSGNVRELRNTIERASILVGSQREIKAEHIVL
ncbi:sigma-54-dependent Fis family transcriptional regulator [Acidobacteria bacterium AB60]|nr:sigma-54-dependent Fis family transcriptional regulator [Acidobacteria bacterium AB60]